MGVSALYACAASHETDIYIPVELENIPTGLSISDLSFEGIEVRIRGAKSAIADLSGLKPTYKLDLSTVRPGLQSIAVEPKRILLPNGVAIIGVNPARLSLTVEKKIEKQVPVVLLLAGKPAQGYKITRATANPENVTLSGPETALTPVEKVRTKPVDVAGRSESFKIKTALELAKNIEILPRSDMIAGEVHIEEAMIEKAFHQIPVQGKGTPYRYGINPSELSITVKGPVNFVEKLHMASALEVYVDLKDLKPGVYVRRATIILPVEATLVDAKPELFTVKISDDQSVPLSKGNKAPE